MKLFDFDALLKPSAAGPNDPTTVLAVRRRAILQAFTEGVARHGWHLLSKGDRFHPGEHPCEIVIGIALWSLPDLQALEDLGEQMHEVETFVCVFNFDDCLTPDELDRFAPGIGPVWKSPVLAQYREGQLIQALQGPQVARWIRDCFDPPSSEMSRERSAPEHRSQSRE